MVVDGEENGIVLQQLLTLCRWRSQSSVNKGLPRLKKWIHQVSELKVAEVSQRGSVGTSNGSLTDWRCGVLAESEEERIENSL